LAITVAAPMVVVVDKEEVDILSTAVIERGAARIITAIAIPNTIKSNISILLLFNEPDDHLGCSDIYIHYWSNTDVFPSF
jgi:hypothetical protein